jgi:hypothetical protein
MHTRFLNYFDAAQNGFISASRYHPNNDDHFEISVELLLLILLPTCLPQSILPRNYIAL